MEYSKLPLELKQDKIPYKLYHRSSGVSLSKRGLFRSRLFFFLITVAACAFSGAILLYFRRNIAEEIVIKTFADAGSVQGPVECPIPTKPPFNLSDPSYNSKLYEANEAFKLGSLDLDDYYNELVEFMPSQEKNIRHFLKPERSIGVSLKNENTKHQIPRYIWQTGKESADKVTGKDALARMRTWMDQAQASFYDNDKNKWDDGWKYSRLTDNEVREMWPQNLDILLEAAAYRSVIMSDSWRLLALALKGGVYSDTDTELLKPITRWWTDTEFGVCDPDYTEPSLIVAVERVTLFNRSPWYQRDARPLQITQWAFAAAEGHPVMVDALRRVTRNVENYVAEHSFTSLSSLFPAKLLRLSGPGPFTDAVLRYLAIKHGIHWWDLLNMGSKTTTKAIQLGETLVLPRLAFNPRDMLSRKKMDMHQSVCLDHSFAGSWRQNQRVTKPFGI